MTLATRKVNPYFELFTLRVTWITEFNLLLLSNEGNNNWHELCVSFQLISSSIERSRTVNSMIHVTRKVNLYFEVFSFRVTWIIELTLRLLSNEADNNWNKSFVCFQLLAAPLERRRRVNSIIQVTRRVNPYFEVFTFRVTWIIEYSLLPLPIIADNKWKETNDSLQILAASTGRRTVISVIQVTRKVNAS